ncbi:biosynthetic-type acetolactate synthase large subunit [Leptospira ilyithenensis]|uniref:Acetolactate synthase n=1 Tax=Leptospira ilyithenensis TaxID=2484901 RepID=A0A4R9LLP6_9LEPT|nr:biosynthetic-type acetolactate synthase large subunit [Leptospira ilyithenensis]TGN07074.1 biosynthetic-type acetolactate synthase large subunit [Leptospira ilyithenensis]
MQTSITVSEYCIRFFESKGIRFLPGLPGGTILPVYDALAKSSLTHVLARHEQGAGFIAQGIARTTGEVTPFLISSGPGVSNAITAVADAFRDSVPILVISGQVPTWLIGTDAFQELDTLSIVRSITKRAYLVTDPSRFPEILEEAFSLCKEGRPGPVWIDLPKDIQNSLIGDFKEKGSIPNEHEDKKILSEDPSRELIDGATELLKNSNKQLLYIGGGAVKSERLIRKISDQFRIPVVSTLMGLGIFSEEDELYLGMMGMHGTAAANEALRDCDLLLAFGVRFDDRATGNLESFCKNAKVIHVDIDKREINKNRKVDLSWNGELSSFLFAWISDLETNYEASNKDWLSEISRLKSNLAPPPNKIHSLVRSVASSINEDAFILTDVGQHQMWVAQSYPFQKPNSWITSGGQGTMGFGLPASIGVALANPGATVLCFTGDGSIMMNLQELSTLKEWNLNVKIILVNNGHLGLVRQQQELFYENRKSGSKFEFQPDFLRLAESFGIESAKIHLKDNFVFFSDWFSKKAPSFLEVIVPEEEGVYPFVPAGKANHEYLLAAGTNWKDVVEKSH